MRGCSKIRPCRATRILIPIRILLILIIVIKPTHPHVREKGGRAMGEVVMQLAVARLQFEYHCGSSKLLVPALTSRRELLRDACAIITFRVELESRLRLVRNPKPRTYNIVAELRRCKWVQARIQRVEPHTFTLARYELQGRT